MVLVPIFLTLEIDILENGIMERNMVLDLWFGNQEENSLDNGTMTKNMDLELNGFKMETDMKVNSKMESKKVKEVITGSMEINIMENGKMILFVEKEKNGVLAEVNMKDNTKMERNMEKVSLLTTLVKKYKVTYDTGKQQTKELFVEDNKEELASLSSDKYDTEVSKWLTENNLSLYIDNFFDQGFEDLEDVGTLSEEEIQEELKITKLGHRRKIMKKINSMGGGSVTDGPKLPERDY
eukprot:TRINITY_DN9_c0_g1_i1.p1 TRINITY_DN9_c0_g1~~TRINITY_DN9_c0_g1_i1.p1  ORF type:complete len:238 (+),score=65.74 TRINITY_DN9_c0_g1_i1:333-1046(+)